MALPTSSKVGPSGNEPLLDFPDPTAGRDPRRARGDSEGGAIYALIVAGRDARLVQGKTVGEQTVAGR